VQSVDLIAWRRLAVSSRNVAIYISSDYIVRQTIIHFIIKFKIFYIFVLNLGEIYLFGQKKKNSFSSKTNALLASWQPKNWFNGLKTAFLWCTFSRERVKDTQISLKPSSVCGLLKRTDNELSTAMEIPDQYSCSQVLLSLYGSSGQIMKTELGNQIRCQFNKLTSVFHSLFSYCP